MLDTQNTEDLNLYELRTQAKAMGLNVRNYGKDKLMQMIAEAKQQPALVSAHEMPNTETRIQEIVNFLKPQIDDGLNVIFDDVSATFSQYGKTICTNLTTPNHVIQRQVHAFLSKPIPVQRAS